MKQNLLNKLKIEDNFNEQDKLKQKLDTYKQQLDDIQKNQSEHMKQQLDDIRRNQKQQLDDIMKQLDGIRNALKS